MPSLLTNQMRPFSHVPGASCMLPSSSWKITAYPTQIILKNLGPGNEIILFSLKISGPIENYTLMQDLERGLVLIFGTGKEGYFSFQLIATSDAIQLILKRAPERGIALSFQGKDTQLKRQDIYVFPVSHQVVLHAYEKIHFGCHKKKDWTLVKRRLNLGEILPIWFAIGKKCPRLPLHYNGTAHLLKECETVIKKKNRLEIGPLLIKLFAIVT